MRRSRRDFIKESAAFGLMVPLIGCGSDGDGGNDDPEMSGSPEDMLPEWTEPGPENLFQHGVASGDPLTDAVILWTRISPPEAAADHRIAVTYEMSLTPDFETVEANGAFFTSSNRDYTVKIDPQALGAGTTYYYRFHALTRTSPIGRTRTAPDGAVERMRFAVMSCSNYAYGHFHGYRHAATRADLDAVIHLGDYIYEYGNGEYGSFRDLQPPHEILTLADYRQRYGWYRSDPDLQAIHQQFPFINVWDDHEFANDANPSGAENHMPGEEGAFADRKAAAMQAYMEWLPIRDPDTPGRIFRTLKFGDLLDLHMLDTRMWKRAPQSRDDGVWMDPERALLGADQLAFLQSQLEASTSHWQLLGQQVLLTPLGLAPAFSVDPWDGYPGARQRLFDILSPKQNVVVLTGDVHASGAGVLTRSPEDFDPNDDANIVGVEFVTPGVTSPFPSAALLEGVSAQNPQLQWGDGAQRGYMVVDVQRDQVQAEWYLYPDPEPSEVDVQWNQGFVIASGTRQLVEQSEPLAAPESAPELAPV